MLFATKTKTRKKNTAKERLDAILPSFMDVEGLARVKAPVVQLGVEIPKRLSLPSPPHQCKL
jgi:hypothetical protein